jgi:hypothetical protein
MADDRLPVTIEQAQSLINSAIDYLVTGRTAGLDDAALCRSINEFFITHVVRPSFVDGLAYVWSVLAPSLTGRRGQDEPWSDAPSGGPRMQHIWSDVTAETAIGETSKLLDVESSVFREAKQLLTPSGIVNVFVEADDEDDVAFHLASLTRGIVAAETGVADATARALIEGNPSIDRGWDHRLANRTPFDFDDEDGGPAERQPNHDIDAPVEFIPAPDTIVVAFRTRKLDIDEVVDELDGIYAPKHQVTVFPRSATVPGARLDGLGSIAIEIGLPLPHPETLRTIIAGVFDNPGLWRQLDAFNKGRVPEALIRAWGVKLLTRTTPETLPVSRATEVVGQILDESVPRPVSGTNRHPAEWGDVLASQIDREWRSFVLPAINAVDASHSLTQGQRGPKKGSKRRKQYR